MSYKRRQFPWWRSLIVRATLQRYMVHHHDDNIDHPIDVGHSSAEEGEALDEYMSSSRK